MPHISLPEGIPGIASGFAYRPETAAPMRELAAAAASHPGGSRELISSVCADPDSAQISAKLKALLAIAGRVQADAKTVTPELVQTARAQGATDLEIHDTVLIAAAFCMYNRYVDGLATWQPRDPEMYIAMGQRLASEGYKA